MAVRVMAMVFDAQGLEPSEKLILLALADHAAEDGRHIYPSTARIVKKTGLSERTVRSLMQQLRQPFQRNGCVVRGAILITVAEATAHFPAEYAIDMRVLEGLKDYVEPVEVKTEVQPLHPAQPENTSRGAETAPQGCNDCRGGVQPLQGWGAAIAPNPSVNHHPTTNNQEWSKSFEKFKKAWLNKYPTTYYGLVDQMALHSFEISCDVNGIESGLVKLTVPEDKARILQERIKIIEREISPCFGCLCQVVLMAKVTE
jgi:hypothetical protein